MTTTLTATRENVRLRRGGVAGFISTWLPVAIGLAIIIIESTDSLSADKTSRFLRPFFAYLFGPMTDEHWHFFHHVLLRKNGHFLGYGTLGMTWLRAWLRTFAAQPWTIAQWRLRSAVLGVVCTFLTASADEYHQSFLPSRTGQFSDVLLDTCGALIFTLIVANLWRRSSAE